jgi:monofunctional biosynthetic peptidoglycan transglycosylase
MAAQDRLKESARPLLRWIKAHKIVSVGILILFWILAEIATLPYGQVARLKKTNPSETALMKERADQEKERGKPFKIRQRWVSLESVSRDIVNAVIVAEDGTFWSHEGFDWYEFRESVERDIKEGRAARGASTITQQLVKNIFLSSSKNPLRKLKEWVLTWYMERVLRKSRILELYLNVIEWGDGVYGVEAASAYYFGKPASQLSREEAARLAAIIPNPRRFRADEDSRYVLRRSNLILERMAARGY